MPRILHIQASPRGAESFSLRAAEALLAELTDRLDGAEVDTLDLFTAEIPAFAAPAAKAKYAVMGGQEPADEAQRAWAKVIAVIEHLKAADAYVISSGMWNFGIPYRLKQYIDVIVQPGLTFRYTPGVGYEGLVVGKPAALVVARGGAYLEGTGREDYDSQLPYLRTILRYIGFDDIAEVVVEPTLQAGADFARQALEAALGRARAVGREMAGKL